MVRVNGNTFLRRGVVPFNTAQVHFSDVATATGGGSAIVINDFVTGVTYQNDILIGATIYLVFADGPSFKQIDEDASFTDPVRKEFKAHPAEGEIEFPYDLGSDPLDITIFYSSSGTSALPATEPVTLQEAKDYCKIDTGTDEDDIITDLITTAREQCEDYSGLSIVLRTVTAYLNNSCGGIFLPYGPVIEVQSVTDQDDNVLSLDDEEYKLSQGDFPQLLDPWDDRIKVIYTAGYGIPPKRIKTAILQQVFFLYENRGESPMIYRGSEADITLSPQAKATLQRLRRVA